MQTIFTILIVVAAISYLGWQFYQRFFAKETKCDSCAVGEALKK